MKVCGTWKFWLKIILEKIFQLSYQTWFQNISQGRILFECELFNVLLQLSLSARNFCCVWGILESHKGFFKRNALSSIFWNYLKAEFSSVLKPHQTNGFFHILSYFFEHVDRGCFFVFLICFWVKTSAKRNHLYVVIFARAANYVKTTKVSWML